MNNHAKLFDKLFESLSNYVQSAKEKTELEYKADQLIKEILESKKQKKKKKIFFIVLSILAAILFLILLWSNLEIHLVFLTRFIIVNVKILNF